MGGSNFLSSIVDNSETNGSENKTSFLGMENEFRTYESLNFVAEPENQIFSALSFYKHHKKEIPGLAEVAQLVFSVTASSVPSENLFSSAGLVQTEVRNRIDPSALEMVNFVIKNKFN